MNTLLQELSGGHLIVPAIRHYDALAHWLGLQPSYACMRLIVQVGIITGICANSEKEVENHV